MRTTQPPHLFLLIRGILAAYDVDMSRWPMDLSQLRCSVTHGGIFDEAIETSPLEIRAIEVAIDGEDVSTTITFTDDSQLLLFGNACPAMPFVFRTPNHIQRFIRRCTFFHAENNPEDRASQTP